jgi:hypothetical protein
VTDRKPSTEGRNRDVFSLIINEVKNLTNCNFITCSCLLQQENAGAKFLKMETVVTVLSKQVNFVR